MVETSEKQMDRRQSVVDLYVTLCVALLALFGAAFSFGSLLVSFVLSLVVGAILILLTWNWSKTLKGI
jgi:Flp pilus assembly protein TadB